MRTFVVAAVAVLLAGCSDAASSDGAVPTATTGMTTAAAGAVPAMPTEETLPFSFDGNLGTFVHGCVFPVETCDTREVVADATDLYVERPGANLTALSFEVTWTAQSPATQTLEVGAMVMRSCEGCSSVEFIVQRGPSPLAVSVTDLDEALNETSLVHVYVYNPQGFVYDPNVPGYALVSVDQSFHIEGTATVRVPPA